MEHHPPRWLIYCRPGFERDCCEETQAQPLFAESGKGYVIVQGKPRLSFQKLVFARQLLRLHGEVHDLPEHDRLTPLLAALPASPERYGALLLEMPDSNEGKTLSGFTRRFQPLLEQALRQQGRLSADPALPRQRHLAGEASRLREEVQCSRSRTEGLRPTGSRLPLQNLAGEATRLREEVQCSRSRTEGLRPTGSRLHIFFPDKRSALIATSDPANSSPAHMGIQRVSMSPNAPSRSYLKLAEAFEVLLTDEERARWLKPGMHAVDLGAAPGGWSWQLVERGLKVTAVDNGPLKGAAASHTAIRHLRQDGFRFRPQRPVDWLVCDMVEQPQRVAQLMAEWLAQGWAKRAIFNLKLPMKKRHEAVRAALDHLHSSLLAQGIKAELRAKQLYHDREEVTVLLAR